MSRKYKSRLTFEMKRQVLADVDKGLKKKEIAKIYGIPMSTLSTYIKNREKIETTTRPSYMRRKRPAKYEDLEKEIYTWYLGAMAQSVEVTYKVLSEKAEDIARKRNIDGFMAKNAWMDRFRRRYSLHESVSRDLNLHPITEDERSSMPKALRKFINKNIYTVCVTGLFYGFLPSSCYALREETCADGEMANSRLTLLLTVNADGSHKLPLLAIGKSKWPKCFGSCKCLPLPYHANSKAWISSHILHSWFRELDLSFQKENRKVAVIINNHCNLSLSLKKLENITIVKQKPDELTVFEPLNKAMVSSLKRHYRRLVMEKLIVHTDEGKPINEFHQNTLDTMYDLRTAWNRVPATTISEECWKDGSFLPESTPTNIASSSFSNPSQQQSGIAVLEHCAKRFLPHDVSSDQYFSFQEAVCTSHQTGTEELDWQAEDQGCISEEEESEIETETPLTVDEARQAISTLREYVLAQNWNNAGVFMDSLLNITSKMDEDSVKRAAAKRDRMKQTSIVDFLKV